MHWYSLLLYTIFRSWTHCLTYVAHGAKSLSRCSANVYKCPLFLCLFLPMWNSFSWNRFVFNLLCSAHIKCIDPVEFCSKFERLQRRKYIFCFILLLGSLKYVFWCLVHIYFSHILVKNILYTNLFPSSQYPPTPFNVLHALT